MSTACLISPALISSDQNHAGEQRRTRGRRAPPPVRELFVLVEIPRDDAFPPVRRARRIPRIHLEQLARRLLDDDHVMIRIRIRHVLVDDAVRNRNLRRRRRVEECVARVESKRFTAGARELHGDVGLRRGDDVHPFVARILRDDRASARREIRDVRRGAVVERRVRDVDVVRIVGREHRAPRDRRPARRDRIAARVARRDVVRCAIARRAVDAAIARAATSATRDERGKNPRA